MSRVIERPPNIRLVGFGEPSGWCAYGLPNGTLWFKGHLYGDADPLAALSGWPSGGSDSEIASFLNGLDGHFALLFEGQARVIAAVDPVRSSPLFFWEEPGETIIAAAGSELGTRTVEMTANASAALSLAMSGYTIGAETIYKKLHQLAPGEFLTVSANGCVRARYHRYAPWAVEERDENIFERSFLEMNLSLFQRLVRGSANRQIVVPLSAGRDSRLIVSALAEIGHRNVVCFAYGLPGNFEADASCKIAKHLGYDWHFVAMTPSSVQKFWTGPLNARYQDFADSHCATTIVHDLPVVADLLERKIIDRTAIVINGNSGDYITGLHIQSPVSDGLDRVEYDERVSIIVSTLIKKHFRLWNSLASPEHDKVIEMALRREIAALGLGEFDPAQTHGVYEYLEFQDRQSKYVIGRQRIYEFLGVDWRLPLWSRAYLDFWQMVPLRFKRGQALYANALMRSNWGGVWQGEEWKFPPRVSPPWMRGVVRPLAKALCAPFGRRAWHAFEQRYLHYWMDLLAWQGVEPYWRHVSDRRGARHAIAWHTEAYLRRKGLEWNGRSRSPS
jgi:asparagine synthase (glutamine-hydrolysing)